MMKYGDKWLMAQSPFIKGITKKTEAKDGEGESVTGSERVAIEEAGKVLVVILLARNNAADIPSVLLFCTEVYDIESHAIILTSRKWG